MLRALRKEIPALELQPVWRPDMANREQRNNREKRKKKLDKPKAPPAQILPFARVQGTGNKGSAGKKGR